PVSLYGALRETPFLRCVFATRAFSWSYEANETAARIYCDRVLRVQQDAGVLAGGASLRAARAGDQRLGCSSRSRRKRTQRVVEPSSEEAPSQEQIALRSLHE